MEVDDYYSTEESGNWSSRLNSTEICRVCANSNGYLIPIYEGEGLDNELAMKIQKHLPIQISEEDTFPKQVCYQCASTLIAWHELVITCVEADRKIRNIENEEDDEDYQVDNKIIEETPAETCIVQIKTAKSLQPSISDEPVSEEQSESEKGKNSPVKRRDALKDCTTVKIVEVKTPTPGPSAQQASSKSPNVQEIMVDKERTSEDVTTSERFQQLPLTSFSTFEDEQKSWKRNFKTRDITRPPRPNAVLPKTEDGFSRTRNIACALCKETFCLPAERSTHIKRMHPDSITKTKACKEICNGNKHQIDEYQANVLNDGGRSTHELEFETVGLSCDSHDTVLNPCAEICDPLEYNLEACAQEIVMNEEADPDKKKKFVCSVCEKILTRSFDLKRHMKIHVRPKPVRKYPDVEETCISDGDRKKFPCRICGRILTRKFDLQRHLNTHISKEKCVDNLFDSDSTNTRDDGNDVVNSDINADPTWETSGQKDAEKVSKELSGNFFCSICKKSFARKFNLTRHEKQHTADEYGQNVTQKNSVDYEAMSTVKVFVDGRTLYRCDQCNKHLYARSSYIKHLRIHTGEKPFTCHVCGKQFRTSGQLNRHVKDVHEGIKKYPCDICGRKFAHKRARNEHRRVHTGERPCVCHLCGKAFKTKASLYVHSRFHMDVFPHPCPHCDKQFRRRHHLNVHILLHTGEKPHVCHICGKSFRLSKTLKDHVVIHTNKETFECSLCGKHFAQERYLKNHIRSHKMPRQNLSQTNNR